MTNAYTEPVSKLIELGRPDPGASWLDYSALGLTRDHVPDLIRLLEDDELRFMEPPDDLPEDGDDDDEGLPEWYAQIHAWRALGQIQAAEAIPALLGILYQIDDDNDDWLSSDAPLVFGMIGPAAIEPLKKYLADEGNPTYARSATGSALAEIGKRHPAERGRCIQGIADVLEKFATNDEGFNGFLIGDLIEIKAVEKIDLIKRAFSAEAVDEMVNGDVEDVQIEMGLLEERLTPVPSRHFGRFPPAAEFHEDFVPAPKPTAAAKKDKKKRKQEKKSRKKNRKRK